MKQAMDQAYLAYQEKEVPVGAIIVSPDGKVVAEARNTKETLHNPCGHAEVNALMKAGEANKSWRLDEHLLFVTLEPCAMCLGAMIQARIKHLYFGAYDAKGGALSLGYHINNDQRLNHRFGVTGGIQHFSCSKILSDFFKERRQQYRPN